ncbi:MAG TPA: hypothetical protein VGS57_08495 [Thermoanaerobaculia bacterium]|jgi:hypothetical protein|nr:hypothetical protein [Thermoanaerobaculia bacterium]
MARDQLEHVIRAAAVLAEDDEIVVIDSQAILGQYPDAPDELLVSIEADVYPRHHVDRADLIDGSIGEGSPFHDTFGYYAHGVGPETAVLPRGWQQRLVPVYGDNTRGATGLCLEAHDLVLSKYAAGREKDRLFTRAAAKHGLVRREILISRLATLPGSDVQREVIAAAIARDFSSR